jgi:hypothetical protein
MFLLSLFEEEEDDVDVDVDFDCDDSAADAADVYATTARTRSQTMTSPDVVNAATSPVDANDTFLGRPIGMEDDGCAGGGGGGGQR